MNNEIYYSTKKHLGFFSLNDKVTLNGYNISFPLDESLVIMAEWLMSKYGVKYNDAVRLILKKTLWIHLSIVYEATIHTIVDKWYEEGVSLEEINDITDKDISDILWEIGYNFAFGYAWCYPSRKEVEMGKILDE